MTVQETIEQKIQTALTPSHLDVINESHMHNVPPGSESHFKLVIVSRAFENLSMVQRHQKVNGILAKELKNGLHALSMKTTRPRNGKTGAAKSWPRPNATVAARRKRRAD